jgi:IS5 family transposase
MALGDKLYEIDKIMDWDIFRPILSEPYKNKTKNGGRPGTDVIILSKALIIQQMYGLSDPELERSICDRVSFRNFLGWSKTIPDKATI